MPVWVYAPNAEEYDSQGLCGELDAKSCIHDEEGGGLSEITLVHPLDPLGKWRYLQKQYILKAPVPVRQVTEIDMTDPDMPVRVTTVEKWLVSDTAIGANRRLYSKENGGKVMKTLPVGLSVTVVYKGSTRYKCKTKYGTGWVPLAGIEFVIAPSELPDTNTGIEDVEASWAVKDQLFRIYKVVKSLKGKAVTAYAKHISYDLARNETTFVAASASAGAAGRGLLAYDPATAATSGCVAPHDFQFYTDIGDTRAALRWERINPIKALLDPEEGMIKRWGAQLVRDNYDLYLLRNAGKDRGVVIEYGKNLLGMEYEDSDEVVVTRIRPVGEQKNGKPLFLAGDAPWVDSPHIGDYPVVSVSTLDCTATCKVGTNGVTTAQARAEMARLAQAEYDDNLVDLPDVSVKIEYLLLENTAEYRHLKGIAKAFLYDTVTVRHERLGVDIKAEVKRTKFDCLKRRMLSTEIANVRKIAGTTQVATWQIPSGVSGSKLRMESVGAGQLVEQSVGTIHIQLAAITQALIAELAVGRAQIADLAVDQAKIDFASINWAMIETLSARIAYLAKAEITEANIKSANIDWANITTLAAAVAIIARAEITTTNIEAAEINWASITNLATAIADIVSAQIGSADIDYAKIKDLTAGTAIFTQGVGDTLLIARLAVNEANMVSLTVGELMVRGADGHLYRIIPDGEGGATSTAMQVDGGDIVANSITGAKLNVTEIFANSALIGAIKAANLDAVDMVGDTALINTLTTAILNASTVKPVDGSTEIDFLLSRNALAAYIRLGAEFGIAIGRNGGRFQNIIDDDGFVIYRDTLATTVVDDSGLSADQVKAKRVVLNDGSAMEYDPSDGLSILLI